MNVPQQDEKTGNRVFKPSPEVRAVMQALEKKRQLLKQQQKSPLAMWFWLVMIIMIILPLSMQAVGKLAMALFDNGWIAFACLALLIAIAIYAIQKIGHYYQKSPPQNAVYQQIYKERVVLPMLKSIDESFTYQKSGSWLSQFPQLSHILPANQLDNLLFAKINGIHFTMAEYVEKTDETTIHKFCFIVDFNKNLHATTLVCSHGAGRLSLSEKQFKKINLDNAQFNENFLAYSQDETESRYILTPAFMEKMLELNNKIWGVFYFLDNKILFDGTFVKRMKYNAYMPYYDSPFEFNIDASIAAQTKASYENIRYILSVIEELNLDSKIWK